MSSTSFELPNYYHGQCFLVNLFTLTGGVTVPAQFNLNLVSQVWMSHFYNILKLCLGHKGFNSDRHSINECCWRHHHHPQYWDYQYCSMSKVQWIVKCISELAMLWKMVTKKEGLVLYSSTVIDLLSPW